MMRYDRMMDEWILFLLILGAAAIVLLITGIYAIYDHRNLLYRRWLGAFLLTGCGFTTLGFIRVTSPTDTTYHTLTSAAVIAGLFTGVLFCIFFVRYYEERKLNRRPPDIDLLELIDDYIVVLDRNGETVFTTCPEELFQRAAFAMLPMKKEVEWQNKHFSVNFTPVMKKNTPVGYTGVFRNATQEKNLIAELHVKAQKLTEINENLNREVNLDEALLSAKQHKVLSLEIQQEIQTKTEQLEEALRRMKNAVNPDEKTHNLTILAEELRNILIEIRKIVYGGESV